VQKNAHVVDNNTQKMRVDSEVYMKILDPCCGSKMIYYDKNCPMVTFGDIRESETNLCDGRSLSIKPDMLVDVTKLDFKDEEFDIVVFDPPHLIYAGDTSWLKLKYGSLDKADYKNWLKKAFCECFRVIKNDGIMIF
jgi:ubiquinone/menaquinone biosynthesis C-methylase UbiE